MTTEDSDDGYWLGEVETLSIQDASELLGVARELCGSEPPPGTFPVRRRPRPTIERLVEPRDWPA